MGIALGAIVDLILSYILWWFVYPALRGDADPATWVNPTEVQGFSILPNRTYFYVLDEGLLIVVTVLMLASKKFWLVMGFFLGWYSSKYMGLYKALGLP